MPPKQAEMAIRGIPDGYSNVCKAICQNTQILHMV